MWRANAAQHAGTGGKSKQHIKLCAPPCSLRHPPFPTCRTGAGGLLRRRCHRQHWGAVQVAKISYKLEGP